MLAELQRFYKGDPLRWHTMPMRLLEQYLKWLPKLQAREKLDGISTIGLSLGPSESTKHDHQRALLQLQQMAGRQKKKKATRLDLESAGIVYAPAQKDD